MGEQHRSGRDPAEAASTGARRRFPISPLGWVGIAAAMLGIAYFLLPVEIAEHRAERQPPDAGEAAPATAKYNDVATPSTRETPADQQGTAAKSERAVAVDTPAARSK
jgi:hypothetical protein